MKMSEIMTFESYKTNFMDCNLDLVPWTTNDRGSLMALCNAVDRTFLSDRLPYPYTEADADWWLGMVAENDGKEGIWRAIVVEGQIVGSISVERMADEQHSAGSIGYMILTPFWSQGIGTEAVRQICGIAYQELALECIIGEVFPENLASARVLEKNGFQLERTKIGGVVKDGKPMDVKIFVHFGRKI
jgi:RimJ/RimL family protein N-acetyltransferase